MSEQAGHSERFWNLGRNFGLLWSGQTVSQLGDAVIEVTIPVWIGLVTNSPAHVAGVVAAELLPIIAIGPLAGVAADRFDPRRLAVASDITRALLVLSLAIVPFSLWYVYLMSALISACGLVFNPAKNVLVTEIVAPSNYLRAQSLMGVSQSSSLLAGPAIGSALLLAFGPDVGFVFDAVTFAVGAAALMAMRGIRSSVTEPSSMTEPRHSSNLPNLWRQIVAGLAFASRDAVLAVAAVAMVAFHLTETVWFTVDVFFVEQSLGLDKASVGVLWAAAGAGGIVASGLLVRVRASLSHERIFIIGMAIKALATVGYGLSRTFPAGLALSALSGLGGTMLLISLTTMLLDRSPKELVGRVTALFDSVGHLAALLGVAVVAAISSRIDAWVLISAGGLSIGAGAILVSLVTYARGRMRPTGNPPM